MYVECAICNLQMKDRVNGSHLKSKHNINIEEYKRLYPEADLGVYQVGEFQCKICDLIINGNSAIKNKHLRSHGFKNVHDYNKIYEIKYCLCGCGNKTEYSIPRRAFNEYIINHWPHHMLGLTIERYPEWYEGKNFGGWNKGLTKYTDHRLMSASINIKKMWAESPDMKVRMTENYSKTMLKNYGVTNYFSTQVFQERMIERNMKLYGVPHHNQCAENFEKIKSARYKYREYIGPCGKKFIIQGYEDLALNLLLEKFHENDIIDRKSEIPKFMYHDEENKIHRYYPDFFIPSKNKIIEVKSTWTFEKDTNIEFKKNCVNLLGYEYELWLFMTRNDKSLIIIK